MRYLPLKFPAATAQCSLPLLIFDRALLIARTGPVHQVHGLMEAEQRNECSAEVYPPVASFSYRINHHESTAILPNRRSGFA